MLSLLKKDFLLGKHMLLSILMIYIIGLVLIFSHFNFAFYIPFIVLLTILDFNYEVFLLECHSTMRVFLFSAPISKKEYVQSKYLSALLILCVGILSIFVFSLFFEFSVLPVILFTIILTLLFSAVLLPVFLSVETTKLNIFRMILQVIIILLTFSQGEDIIEAIISDNLVFQMMGIITLIVSIFFFLLSYRASIKIIDETEH